MPTSIRDLPLVEQLAIEQAVFNKLGADVSTKSPDSLRGMADEEIVGNYRAMGAKSYDVHVNGSKVGTYSVRTSKEKPQSTSKRLVIKDPYALEKFIEDNINQCVKAEEMPYAELYAQAMAQNFAEYVLEVYGELPDGCEMVTETIPAQKPQVIGTSLRIDADKVADAINGYLPTTIAGILGGGADA